MTDLAIRPDEIDWRVGATYDGRDGKMAMLLGYIDARLAMEKLDALDPNWSSRIEVIRLGERDGIRCSLTVQGVTREDVGTASDTEPLKGAVSDALKRAAVHFGIGRELYDLPTISVRCEVKPNGKVGRPLALPVWKDDRWTIDPKLGWVKYDHEPIEQPGQSEGARSTRAVAAAAPAPARQRLAEAMARHNVSVAALERLSDSIGLERGKRATDEEIERLIELIEPVDYESDQENDGDAPEPLPLPGLTEEEFEQVEAAVEATIPPKPGSPEYRALSAYARSDARAYWAREAVEA